EEKQGAQQQLASCAIALGGDGNLHPPKDLLRTSPEIVQVFTPFGLQHVFLAPENPNGIRELVPGLDLRSALKALATLSAGDFDTVWKSNSGYLVDLINWCAEQRTTLRKDAPLKDRLCSLPLWPSGQKLRPLKELVVPGDFEDPLHLTSL